VRRSGVYRLCRLQNERSFETRAVGRSGPGATRAACGYVRKTSPYPSSRRAFPELRWGSDLCDRNLRGGRRDEEVFGLRHSAGPHDRRVERAEQIRVRVHADQLGGLTERVKQALRRFECERCEQFMA
jgi:hypothetical protein